MLQAIPNYFEDPLPETATRKYPIVCPKGSKLTEDLVSFIVGEVRALNGRKLIRAGINYERERTKLKKSRKHGKKQKDTSKPEFLLAITGTPVERDRLWRYVMKIQSEYLGVFRVHKGRHPRVDNPN